MQSYIIFIELLDHYIDPPHDASTHLLIRESAKQMLFSYKMQREKDLNFFPIWGKQTHIGLRSLIKCFLKRPREFDSIHTYILVFPSVHAMKKKIIWG